MSIRPKTISFITLSTSMEALNQHYQSISQLSLRHLFENDPKRFDHFSLSAAGLFLDYSKHYVTKDILDQLVILAKKRELPNEIEALFAGACVNPTEKRPALHTALRDLTHAKLQINGKDISQDIQNSLNQMQVWVEQLRRGQWLGYTQKPITDVVNIGIGGSYLGPLMLTEALAPETSPIHSHFAASVDPDEIKHILRSLNPETTLFIIASKTFTTQETLVTADYAKKWLEQHTQGQNISQHFLATTADIKKATEYGIAPQYILPFWDWVGGRYSVWSAIGLPVAIQIGMPAFRDLLAGAYEMDQHFRTAPFHQNMPVILGLLGFWYARFFKAKAQAILPYDYRLRSFARYLQQLEMESNGKCVQKNGSPVDGLTTPILFGEIGTNGQHSFHQLLFQGTHFIPCDFIATLHPEKTILLSHCLAQSRGLMWGKTKEEAYQELLKKGHDTQTADTLAPHLAIPGNQPSSTFLVKDITPKTLGALMALYEHKVFVQGIMWNINSFDQWGVALGKEIAQSVLDSLLHQDVEGNYDGSTVGLLKRAKEL